MRKKSETLIAPPFSFRFVSTIVRWTEISELLGDDLITRDEVDAMFQALPKAKGRGSSSSSPAIDVKGFLEFARKVRAKSLCCLVWR